MTKSHREQRKDLFLGWIAEGADPRITPAVVRATRSLPGRTCGVIEVGGECAVVPGTARSLAAHKEHELVELMIASGAEDGLLALAVEEVADRWFWPVEQTWRAFQLRARDELGLSERGPGDIDVIFGPWDGKPRFDWLCGVELKRRTTQPDGEPGPTPSKLGRTQANGLRELGFDLSFLCYLLVGHQIEDPETQVVPMFADHSRTARATKNCALDGLRDDVGYAMVAWSHALGQSPLNDASAQLVPCRAARPTHTNLCNADLEAESTRRGMTQVRANRTVTVTTERERLDAPLEANSNGITEGQSNGWRLIYCKGPEGEQLEFVQALGPVKRLFDDARAARRR